MTPDDKPAKREKGDDLDLLRDVLDWMPADVLMEEADPKDLEILASIDERLDRTIVERARDGAAEPDDEEMAAGADEAPEEPEEPADTETDAEPEEDLVNDPSEAELDEPPTPPTTEEPVSAEVEREPGEVTSLTIEETQETSDPEPEEDQPRVEVVVAETPEDEEEAEEGPDEEPISLAPPVEPAASGPDSWDTYGSLSPFTVVAPPQGSVSGDWIVPGEEQIHGGEVDRLSEGIDSDLDIGGIEEDETAWPEENLFDDELEDELDEDFPGLEDDLGEDPDDDLGEDLFDDETMAEAEPEQDTDAWEAPDEEEEYWESLLEDEEPPEEPPAFEAEEDWETAEETEPAQAEAGAMEVEESPATEIPIEATDDEDPFADLWDEGEEGEEASPAPAAEEQEAPLAFELDEPDEEPGQATEEEEEELAFEEVNFELAPEPEPEPEPEAGAETETETEVAWPEQTVEDEPEPGLAEEPTEETGAGPWDEPAAAQAPEAETAPPPETAPAEEEARAGSEGHAAVEEDAPDLEGEEEAYTHGPYTLYHKVVETGDGDTRDLYFFARSEPEDATAAGLPPGYEVGVNERTGVPFVRRERG